MKIIDRIFDWSPVVGAVFTALAIGNAMLKVADIPNSAWFNDDPFGLHANSSYPPEPGCPSPFPGICEEC